MTKIHDIVANEDNTLHSSSKIRRFIRKVYYFVRLVNIFHTVYVNLINFPLNTAIKFPILVGFRVQFMGLRRRCIRINQGTKIHFGMIRIGMMSAPMFATRGLFTFVRIHKKSHIELGDNIRIFSGANIIVSLGGKLHIGNDFLVNQKSRIYACNEVRFGNHCQIGWESQVSDSDMHYMVNDVTKTIMDCNSPVHIGNNCWIAARCSVMKGSALPDYSILTSNSLLNKDFSGITTTGNLFVGTPAVLKKNGIYRIFNEEIEEKLKKHFASESSQQAVDIPDDYNFYNILD